MIVVYIPKYERHPYCLRAYAAMEELERKRFGGDRPADAKRGLIIPIVFRSGEDLPPNIRSRRHYYDFSRFTLVTPKISDNAEYVDKIEEIAQTIRVHLDLWYPGPPTTGGHGHGHVTFRRSPDPPHGGARCDQSHGGRVAAIRPAM
jgi:hypothetical protein